MILTKGLPFINEMELVVHRRNRKPYHQTNRNLGYRETL